MSEAVRANPVAPWAVLAALSAIDRRRILPVLAADRWVGELATDNPLLFFLLVRAAGAYRLSLRQMQLMARLRRRKLLSVLRCDGSPATERFLRRCGFLQLDLPEHEALLRLAAGALPLWASHWQVPHLRLLTALPEHAWPYAVRALDAILRGDPLVRLPNGNRIRPEDLHGALPPRLAELVDDLRGLAYLIGTLAGQDERRARFAAMARCTRQQHLHDLHAEIVTGQQESWASYVYARVAGHAWPATPVPGNDHIVPITTAAMLIDEGERMHHCIPSYIDRILEGSGFAYRVLAPQRATLFIVPVRGGRWQRDEMRLACNGWPAEDTFAAVDGWLERQPRRRAPPS